MSGPLSVWLAVMLSVGIALVFGAGCFAVWHSQVERDNLILRRLSGRLREGQGLSVAEDPVHLRRGQKKSYWASLWAELVPEGMASRAGRLVSLGFALGMGIFATVFVNILGLSAILAVLLAFILCFGICVFLARVRRKRRILAIEEALPEALDMIVRALRVGLPVMAAVQAAERDLVGPIAQEFAQTTARISYGQDPVSAFRDMAARCQNQSVYFFAAAVALQMSTGGNLADVIERLALIARGRQQMKRKINSITAEAKWSGSFLSAFPLLAVAMLLSINPQYFADIEDQPFYYPMLCVVGGLLVLNVLFMRWLVKLD